MFIWIVYIDELLAYSIKRVIENMQLYVLVHIKSRALANPALPNDPALNYIIIRL